MKKISKKFRAHRNPKRVICIVCGQPCYVGRTAIYNNSEVQQVVCINCVPFEFDKDGNVWLPGEMLQQRIELRSNNIFSITREEAFS